MAVRRLAADRELQPKELRLHGGEPGLGQEGRSPNIPDGRQASAVIPLLWRAQEQHDGWLPEPAIRYVADMLGMAYIRVLEVATFYTMFHAGAGRQESPRPGLRHDAVPAARRRAI